MFAYYFTPAAEKEIGGLPKRFQRQIFDAVEEGGAAACGGG